MDSYKYLLPEINRMIDTYCKTKLEYLDELYEGCPTMKFKRCGYCKDVICMIYERIPIAFKPSCYKKYSIIGGYYSTDASRDGLKVCIMCSGGIWDELRITS